MQEYHGVCIFGEWSGEDIHEVTYELLGEGRRLADKLNVPLLVIFLGPPEAEKKAIKLTEFGADEVILALDQKLSNFLDDVYARLVAKILSEYRPEVMLFSATALGQALAPRVAAILKVGLTAHCIAFDIRDEDRALIQIRPSFGENVMARIVSLTKPQMATVRPGVFKPAKLEPGRKGKIHHIELSQELLDSNLEILEKHETPKRGVDLSKAKIIVAGGRGLGNKELFKKLFELAELLNGAVGATRPVCHMGWVSEEHMIGVSGSSVSPRLYIGFGISGALHHLVGIREVETLVAINTDPEAPIMKKANIAVVGDAGEIIPQLIQRLKRIKGVET